MLCTVSFCARWLQILRLKFSLSALLRKHLSSTYGTLRSSPKGRKRSAQNSRKFARSVFALFVRVGRALSVAEARAAQSIADERSLAASCPALGARSPFPARNFSFVTLTPSATFTSRCERKGGKATEEVTEAEREKVRDGGQSLLAARARAMLAEGRRERKKRIPLDWAHALVKRRDATVTEIKCTP